MAFNPEGVDSWRNGYENGTKEAFEWCMKTAAALAVRAKTDDGIKAMLYMVKKISEEQSRRYPEKNDSGSSD